MNLGGYALQQVINALSIGSLYALMAVGGAVIVFAEWTYLEWSRQALPGPADARSQLQKTAFMLARQVMLMNTAPICVHRAAGHRSCRAPEN